MYFEKPHFCSAGRFISRGHGRHPARRIDSYELIFVLSGSLEIREEEKIFSVCPGERLFLFPGRRHGGVFPYEPDLSFFWMHFTFGNGFSLPEDFPRHARVASNEYFRNYAQMLLSEQHRGMAGQKICMPENPNADLLTEILLNEAVRPADGSVPYSVPSYSSRLADEADRYIRIHFDESLTTCGIAKKLQCNPDYLSRLYRLVHGCTVGDAIRRERTSKACALLENTALSVKQTAYESGFGDVSHFRRQFLRDCGMTPGAYRKLHRGGHVNTE